MLISRPDCVIEKLYGDLIGKKYSISTTGKDLIN